MNGTIVVLILIFVAAAAFFFVAGFSAGKALFAGVLAAAALALFLNARARDSASSGCGRCEEVEKD